MARSPHGTRADTTFEQLRADILAGRLKPGARLKFPLLSERYGVGVGVIREALTRLAQQGLAVNQPHLGFQVMPLSRADLTELTQARVEIEGLVFRHSIEEGDMGWEAAVVAAHHKLVRTPQYDAADPERLSDGWSQVHNEFHRVLLAGCSNARLTAAAAAMRDAAEIYRAWSQQTSRHPDRDPAAEHRNLMELALARDADAAVEALGEHIVKTTEVLLSSELSTEGR